MPRFGVGLPGITRRTGCSQKSLVRVVLLPRLQFRCEGVLLDDSANVHVVKESQAFMSSQCHFLRMRSFWDGWSSRGGD
eukprot:3463777-Pyramimonas_sp.AAC.1